MKNKWDISDIVRRPTETVFREYDDLGRNIINLKTNLIASVSCYLMKSVNVGTMTQIPASKKYPVKCWIVGPTMEGTEPAIHFATEENILFTVLVSELPDYFLEAQNATE